MHHRPSLVQIMACRLFGAKPLSEPMMEYFSKRLCQIRNKFQWNFNRDVNIFIQENAFENVVVEMSAIFCRPQCVIKWNFRYSHIQYKYCFAGHRIYSPVWDTTLQLVFFRLWMILIYLNLTTASKMVIAKHITVTSWWVRWRHKSPASRVFIQPFVQAWIKENIKAPRHCPLWEEFTGDRWIHLTKSQ